MCYRQVGVVFIRPKICPLCGFENQSKAETCSKCGVKLPAHTCYFSNGRPCPRVANSPCGAECPRMSKE